MVRGLGDTKRIRFIDLSIPISPATPEPQPPNIEYVDHRHAAAELAAVGNGLLEKALHTHGTLHEGSFRDGLGLANENLRLDSHSGTHMDAPWHFGPLCNEQPAKTIDQIPVEWCFGPGVRLDLRHKKPGDLITPRDLEEALEKIPYTLQPRDIVLLMTGADKHLDQKDYFFAHAGMGRDATLWLLDRGVKIIGIDGWGFDRPADAMLRDYVRTGDSSFLLPAHMVGRDREYCHIEKLANLDHIPVASGFWVACFPIKIEHGSAGWVRAVALVTEAAA